MRVIICGMYKSTLLFFLLSPSVRDMWPGRQAAASVVAGVVSGVCQH